MRLGEGGGQEEGQEKREAKENREEVTRECVEDGK